MFKNDGDSLIFTRTVVTYNNKPNRNNETMIATSYSNKIVCEETSKDYFHLKFSLRSNRPHTKEKHLTEKYMRLVKE